MFEFALNIIQQATLWLLLVQFSEGSFVQDHNDTKYETTTVHQRYSSPPHSSQSFGESPAQLAVAPERDSANFSPTTLEPDTTYRPSSTPESDTTYPNPLSSTSELPHHDYIHKYHSGRHSLADLTGSPNRRRHYYFAPKPEKKLLDTEEYTEIGTQSSTELTTAEYEVTENNTQLSQSTLPPHNTSYTRQPVSTYSYVTSFTRLTIAPESDSATFSPTTLQPDTTYPPSSTSKLDTMYQPRYNYTEHKYYQYHKGHYSFTDLSGSPNGRRHYYFVPKPEEKLLDTEEYPDTETQSSIESTIVQHNDEIQNKTTPSNDTQYLEDSLPLSTQSSNDIPSSSKSSLDTLKKSATATEQKSDNFHPITPKQDTTRMSYNKYNKNERDSLTDLSGFSKPRPYFFLPKPESKLLDDEEYLENETKSEPESTTIQYNEML